MKKVEFMAGGISRRTFLKRSGSLLGAAVLAQEVPKAILGLLGKGDVWQGILPSPASAMVCYFDPAKFPTETGFTLDGDPNQQVVPGASLIIKDNTANSHVAFYGPNGAAIAGTFEMSPSWRVDTDAAFSMDGRDTGVRAGFTDGAKQFMACLIEGAGVLRVALLQNGGFSAGLALDWRVPCTCTVRRTATGDAELVAGGQTETVPNAFLADSVRTGPTIEFGCFSDAALATALFTDLGLPGAQPSTYPATLTPSRLQLRVSGTNKKVQVQTAVALAAGSDGIDPSMQPVTLRLSTPAGQFYPPPGADFMPLNGFDRTSTGWVLNAAEKSRTGIQSLVIDETLSGFTFSLVDIKAAIGSRDYSTVIIELAVGNDSGSARVQLTDNPAGSRNWSS